MAKKINPNASMYFTKDSTPNHKCPSCDVDTWMPEVENLKVYNGKQFLKNTPQEKPKDQIVGVYSADDDGNFNGVLCIKCWESAKII